MKLLTVQPIPIVKTPFCSSDGIGSTPGTVAITKKAFAKPGAVIIKHICLPRIAAQSASVSSVKLIVTVSVSVTEAIPATYFFETSSSAEASLVSGVISTPLIELTLVSCE